MSKKRQSLCANLADMSLQGGWGDALGARNGTRWLKKWRL